MKDLKEYINALADYIKQNPTTFDEPTDSPCMDALWWHYAGFFPLRNDKTKQKHAELRNMLSDSNLKDVDEIIAHIGGLCTEYERIAFISGMKLGMQLMIEAAQKEVR